MSLSEHEINCLVKNHRILMRVT